MHPGCVGIFAFDNSTSHGAFADDALIAKHMNLNPGGKQHKLRDTVFNNQVQKMVFPDGQPKGMRIVLQERNLWRDGLRDRKSTRLNSSHSQISYAVFCLKKK